MQVHAAPLADGGRAVVLFNRHTILSQYTTTNFTGLCSLALPAVLLALRRACCHANHKPASCSSAHQLAPAAPVLPAVWWEQVGLPKGSKAVVRDLFEEKDLGEFEASFSAEVGIHAVLMLRVTPTSDGAKDTSWRPWHNQPMFRAEAEKEAGLSGMAGAVL